jgi:hypothetical protein
MPASCKYFEAPVRAYQAEMSRGADMRRNPLQCGTHNIKKSSCGDRRSDRRMMGNMRADEVFSAI